MCERCLMLNIGVLGVYVCKMLKRGACVRYVGC
jgi:hypothetical protein